MSKDTKIFLVRTTLTYDIGYAVEAKTQEEAIRILKNNIQNNGDYYESEVYQTSRTEIVNGASEIDDFNSKSKAVFKVLKDS